MDRQEALRLLNEVLDRFRQQPYEHLAARVDAEPFIEERLGPSGRRYQIEIECFWDGERGAHVRVVGAVDDGGWRAFVPLAESFIKAPDGRLVGE